MSSSKYTIMFMAGGRLNGSKISEAEKTAMLAYIAIFKKQFPEASILPSLGMANVMLTEDVKLELENNPNIHSIKPFKVIPLNSTLQYSAPWHLSNISKNQFSNYEYTTTGKNITVYVMDTGIDINNYEFEGRAKIGYRIASPTWSLVGEETADGRAKTTTSVSVGSGTAVSVGSSVGVNKAASCVCCCTIATWVFAAALALDVACALAF